MAKVWANSLVILVATGASLFLVVQMALKVPFAGSVVLWFVGVVLYLFFATALGIFLGTISRSMAQFALLIILVIVVLMLLSGGSTPVESQPKWLQYVTYLLPARHFVSFSQVIIYRGGGLRRGLAAVPDGERGRPRLLRLQPVAVPQVDRGQQVGAPSRISRPLRCASPGGGHLGKSESTMNDAPATVAVPWFSAVAEYMLDAWQRTVLTWDVLRERGNQALDHARSGKPPVLVFDYEPILDARTLPEARELHPPPRQAHGRSTADGPDASGRWS